MRRNETAPFVDDMAGLIRQLEAADGMTNPLSRTGAGDHGRWDTGANGRSDPELGGLGVVSALMHLANRTPKCTIDSSGQVISCEPVVPEHVYKKCKEHWCIPFLEEFTHETIGKFLEHHENLMAKATDEIRKQMTTPTLRKDVNIVWVIDSGGGDTSAVMMVIDIVAAMDAFNDKIKEVDYDQKTTKPVGKIMLNTVVLTKAWSCGAIMFSLAKPGHRYVTNHSTVLFHQPRSVYGARGAPISFSAGSATNVASTLKLLGEKLYLAAEKTLLPPKAPLNLKILDRRNNWFKDNILKLTEILMRNRNGFAVRSGMSKKEVAAWLLQRSEKLTDKEPILLFLMLDVYENNTDHFMSSEDVELLDFAKAVSEVWTYPAGHEVHFITCQF